MKYYISNSDYEIILISDTIISFGKHNHSTKYVIGMVLSGCAFVEDEYEKKEYVQGEYFVIPPYQVHGVNIYDKTTRLLNICIGEEFLKENKIMPQILNNSITELFMEQGIDKKYMLVIERAYSDIVKICGERICAGADSIDEAHRQIRDLPEKPLNIDRLARLSNVSKYHFIRIFRKKVGLTPHNYQIQNRIRKAQKLLRKGRTVAGV